MALKITPPQLFIPHYKGKDDIEIGLIIDAILHCYGYDFRNYGYTSIKRRILHFCSKMKIDPLSKLLPQLIHNRHFFETLLNYLAITVTEMFRDPPFYKAMRQTVVPHLKTYPFINVWHAGCSTGEEAYSSAILLTEENFMDRTRIYATDFNPNILRRARQGIYPLSKIQLYTSNYHLSGGKSSFTDYYHADYQHAKIESRLGRDITWACHNLATDGIFGEMQLIICRNVLIYFNRDLQSQVLEMFYQSLSHRGFLCLGPKESLMFHSIKDRMESMPGNFNIFRKK